MRAFHHLLQSVQPSQLTVIIMFLAITLGFLVAVSFAAGPQSGEAPAAEVSGPTNRLPAERLMENYARARHYLSIHDASHAIEFYRAVLEADESNVRALHDLARAYLMNEEPDEALERINKALELDPVHGALYFTRGRILDALGEHRQALDSYLTFAALNPDDLATVDALGRAETLMNDLQEEIDPETLIRYRGKLFMGLGFPVDAIHHLQNARLADTDDARTLFLMGRAYQYLGEPDRAIEFYRQALAEDEDNPLFWYYLSSSYRQQGDDREALTAWRHFVEEAPHSLANIHHIPSLETPANNLLEK